MNVKFYNSKEKKSFVEQMKSMFGIEELDYLLLETGKEKIRAFSGSFTREDIMDFAEIANVEIIGLYFAKKDMGTRLSFDATQLVGKDIKKNIIEIDEQELGVWMRGGTIDREASNGIYVLKCGEDFVGCAYSNGKRLLNLVPKERQIRN